MSALESLPSGDRLDVRASSWGGEPYNMARLDVARARAYAFRFDYRNLIYFNSIPFFANPILGQGVLFSQRSLDTRRRQVDTELELLPAARLSPFFAYSRSSGDARGVTAFVVDGDEFPVAARLRDATDFYRGGVRLNCAKLNLTVEQGGATFKDDQEVGFSGGVNPGNRATPLVGQDILLRDLRQSYGGRGRSHFSRGVIQAHPWTRLDFTGQFLYAKPSFDVSYVQQNSGNFLLLDSLLIFTGQLDRSIGEASRPHSSASWAAEIRPIKRVRLIQSWFTDRFHISASSFLAQSFTTASGAIDRSARASDRLVLNYNQHQVDAIVEAASCLSLRGGHRYQWGDASGRAPALTPSGAGLRAELARHVALAGAALRFGAALEVNLDLEAAAGDRSFFRTDLADYRRAKARGRYRLAKSLTLSGSFLILDNQNSAPGVGLDFQSRRSSLALLWTPADGRRWSLLADYTRGTVRSSLPFLAPQDRVREISRYRDDGHYGGATAEVRLWRDARLEAGGSFSITSGGRPVRYYQPQGRLAVPLHRRVSWTSEWRWLGFDERRFTFESFHTHLFSTGLRIGR